jgi:hypothetical protein
MLVIGLGLTARGLLQWRRGEASIYGPVGIVIVVTVAAIGFRALSRPRSW